MVSQTIIHLFGQEGELGQQQDSFTEWEQTSKDLPAARHQDFAIPIFSHGVNSRDICRTVEGECGGRAPKLLWYLWNHSVQCVHCSGCPCPSALPSGCYFYITHVFFVWTSCFHEETPQKMPLMPQCAAAAGALLRVALTGIKRHRRAVGLRWGSGWFEHVHIVSVKGQAAR